MSAPVNCAPFHLARRGPAKPVGSVNQTSRQLGLSLLKLLISLCVVQMLCLLALLWTVNTQKESLHHRSGRPTTTETTEPYFAGKPGPWGELEYMRIQVEPNDETIEAEIRHSLAVPTRWFFAAMTPEQVWTLLTNVGLSAAQLAELRQSPTLADAEGVIIEPPHSVIFGMNEAVRARLYGELGKNELNELYAWPFTWRQGGWDEWISHSGLSDATLALVQQVLFRRGSAYCVSDLNALCTRTTDPEERRRLIKMLSRSSALLMKVRIRPDSDIESLTQYWGRGMHVKDIERLLRSLTKVQGSVTLDVVHLLPPFARKRINCFPTPRAPGETQPDCYWSSWNFFNDPPDDRYYNFETWRTELAERCQQVEAPLFGDLVFLCRPDGIPIHAAVYIADDVVFTKNGSNPRQPWKLMKMEDMLARYATDYVLRIAYFRTPEHFATVDLAR